MQAAMQGKKDATCSANNNKIDSSDIKMDFALARVHCKRLSDLFAICKRNLARTEIELHKEHEKNSFLQHKILTLTKEFKAILNNEFGLSKIISIFKKK